MTVVNLPPPFALTLPLTLKSATPLDLASHTHSHTPTHSDATPLDLPSRGETNPQAVPTVDSVGRNLNVFFSHPAYKGGNLHFQTEQRMNHCQNLIEYLEKSGETIAIAETFSAALITRYLNSSGPVQSEVFVGSIIASATHVLTDLLDVSPGIADDKTTGSQILSDQLVLHLPRKMKAGIYLGVSGAISNGKHHCFASLLNHGQLRRKEILVESSDQLCEELFGFISDSLIAAH